VKLVTARPATETLKNNKLTFILFLVKEFVI